MTDVLNKLCIDDDVHFAINRPYNGAVSLCGNNGATRQYNGRWYRDYGGARRTKNQEKITCQKCLNVLNN